MSGSLILIAVILLAGLVWGCVRLTVWIIKTAAKEALREYDAEKYGQK